MVRRFASLTLCVLASVLLTESAKPQGPRDLIVFAGRPPTNLNNVERGQQASVRDHLDDLAIPDDDWRWVIVSEGSAWQEIQRKFGLRGFKRETEKGFTHLLIRTSYVNGRLLLPGNYGELRLLLAHEYEHRFGGTEEEVKTRAWDRVYGKKK